MEDESLTQEIPNILIVDDTPANLELLAGMLRERGYEPRPVPNGRLALAAIQADPPDLILLDIRMPEMDGFEVCARLKADEARKDIPVIFITALTDTEAKVRAFGMGAVDYVTKPFQGDEIEARVKAHLRVQSLQRQLRAKNEHLERQVAERTRELASAYERLVNFGRIKDDFLGMISHELRTPANGVLGIGDLILDLCPDSEDGQQYARLFRDSSLRLRNLIDDATLIADMNHLAVKNWAAVPFPMLLAWVRTARPQIEIWVDQPAALETVSLLGDPRLLKKALETSVLLAAAFSKNEHTVRLSGSAQAGTVQVRLELDDLQLSMEETASFFELESLVRASSAAEPLGLAPVVAHRILAAFDGQLKLVKGPGCTGYLVLIVGGEAEG